MTHIDGQQDADLHNEDGTHRSTPPTADGRQVELFEERIKRHLASHVHNAAGKENNNMTEPFSVVKVIFTNEDVKAIANEVGVDHDTAFARVDEWAKAIEGHAISLVNEQLASVIEHGAV